MARMSGIAFIPPRLECIELWLPVHDDPVNDAFMALGYPLVLGHEPGEGEDGGVGVVVPHHGETGHHVDIVVPTTLLTPDRLAKEHVVLHLRALRARRLQNLSRVVCHHAPFRFPQHTPKTGGRSYKQLWRQHTEIGA